MPPSLDLEELDRVPTDQIRADWSGLLGSHYATRPPDRFTRFDQIFEEHPSDFLGFQIASHLECLGYLTAFELDTLEPENGWKRAFALWQAELHATPAEHLSIELDGENLDKLTELERGIRLLKAVCSFEGEVSIKADKSVSMKALPSRIAAYRLRSFGFLQEDETFDQLDWSLVSLVEQKLARPSFPQMSMINLLGDLPELSSRFAQTQHGRVFAFAQTQNGAQELINRYRIKRTRRLGIGQSTFRSPAATKRHASGTRIHKAGRHTSAHLRPTLDPGLHHSSGDKAASADAVLSQFSLFLLQARLWTYGYYRGALDGEWGLMIAKALGRFVDEHESETDKKEAIAKRSDWLAGNSQALVIDLAYLLSYMVSRLDEAAELTARREIDTLVAVALDNDSDGTDRQSKVSATEKNLTEEIIKSHEKRRRLQEQDRVTVDAALGASRRVRRRRYFGWRSVFIFAGRALRWVGNTIQNTLAWIKKKIRKVVHYATSLLNYIREKTRRAVRLVALGFQRLKLWLTQAPVVTVRGDSCVATRFYRDFDTINFHTDTVGSDAVQDHMHRIEALNAGFGFLVEVSLSVWSILSALKYSVANWLLVAWRSYRAIRKAIVYIDAHESLLEKLEPAVA